MKKLLLLVFIFPVAMAFSQDTQEFKGKIYIKKNNHWYTENDYEVNQNVLTIKIKKGSFS